MEQVKNIRETDYKYFVLSGTGPLNFPISFLTFAKPSGETFLKVIKIVKYDYGKFRII